MTVSVFVRSGTAWTEQAKLTASDAAGGDGLVPERAVVEEQEAVFSEGGGGRRG